MLNANNLAIVDLACKDQTRFAMNGVMVYSDFTAVTNGHYLLKVDRPAGVNSSDFPWIEALGDIRNTGEKLQPFTMPIEATNAMLKAIPKKSTLPILEHVAIGTETTSDGGKRRVRVGQTDLASKVVRDIDHTGQCPEVDRVIPKKDGFDVAISVNLDYLLGICKAMAKTTKKQNGKRFVTLFVKAGELQDKTSMVKGKLEKTFFLRQGPMMLESETEQGQTVTAVLMPTSGEKGCIDWYQSRDAKPAAAESVEPAAVAPVVRPEVSRGTVAPAELEPAAAVPAGGEGGDKGGSCDAIVPTVETVAIEPAEPEQPAAEPVAREPEPVAAVTRETVIVSACYADDSGETRGLTYKVVTGPDGTVDHAIRVDWPVGATPELYSHAAADDAKSTWLLHADDWHAAGFTLACPMFTALSDREACNLAGPWFDDLQAVIAERAEGGK